MFVRNCFAFSPNTTELDLIDADGCPRSQLISPFTYNGSYHADATIYSMFRFPESSKIHIQCDIIMCRGGCPPPSCDTTGKLLKGTAASRKQQAPENGVHLLASVTGFVIDPDDEICES